MNPASGSTKGPPTEPSEETGARFADDLAFLKQFSEVRVLTAPGGVRVAVAPDYQARVMTSAVSEQGRSLGWINRAFITAGKTGTQFDNYGGEDRFWLGPEGGQYGLYFPSGQPFEFSNWQTPPAFQQGGWAIARQSAASILFSHTFELDNYAGTHFRLAVEREISVLGPDAVEKRLGVGIPEGVQAVAFESRNSITNRGTKAWTQSGGLPSIWILAMFPPAPDSWVVVPFVKEAEGSIVNDRYFGEPPRERLLVDDGQGVLLFRCDGKLRSKIGLPYARAKTTLGSYSRSARQLTIVHYDLPGKPAPYVNSMWEHQAAPYAGDVVNSYNDGPTEPGKPALGGFYELETSSPGAELAPGESLTHTHRTFHFVGDEGALDAIANRALGVSLGVVPR